MQVSSHPPLSRIDSFLCYILFKKMLKNWNIKLFTDVIDFFPSLLNSLNRGDGMDWFNIDPLEIIGNGEKERKIPTAPCEEETVQREETEGQVSCVKTQNTKLKKRRRKLIGKLKKSTEFDKLKRTW